MFATRHNYTNAVLVESFKQILHLIEILFTDVVLRNSMTQHRQTHTTTTTLRISVALMMRWRQPFTSSCNCLDLSMCLPFTFHWHRLMKD